MEASEVDEINLHMVRLVVYSGTRWVCDPSLENIEAHWKFWVQENQPLACLQWDPGEYGSIGPFK